MPQIVPLIILIPAIGAFINIFWGARMGERPSAVVGIFASTGAFVVALLLHAHLFATGFEAVVVNPAFFSDWIRIPSANINIPWQLRVDTLSVTMMLVVTGVGTLIHVFAMGYMHGDPRFSRFFAYLNMFLAFMLILVTANNLLMLFVGWEGVGVCSYLLIGFWFDKAHGEGWRNANAARKAFVANRIGDFGLLLAIFLTFWTFGTLDFFKPGEIVNVGLAQSAYGAAQDADISTDGGIGDTPATPEAQAATGAGRIVLAAQEPPATSGLGAPAYTSNDHLRLDQLGIFGQAERLLYESTPEQPVMISFGPFSYSLQTVLTFITIFMLIGAAGKSAQIPLFVWLPDAMAGPTPVSALIHAATMVTAGVYLMVRSNVFFYNAPLTSFIVALIGALTAIMAGFIAVGQWDIKRVLAYSTISQLGFMVAAVGFGAYAAAVFHLVTHAFFKALLFLGSGSVIHGMEHGHHHLHDAHGHAHDDHALDTPGEPVPTTGTELPVADEHDDPLRTHDADAGHTPDAAAAHGHGALVVAHSSAGHGSSALTVVPDEDRFDPQDMRTMGGLRARMPVTFWTYVIGTLALAGIFPFAGFWSKDEILVDAWLRGIEDGGLVGLGGFIALGLLLLAAGFTAFYMWRQVALVFLGRPRHEAAQLADESAPSMTIPLVVLAFFSLTVGFINVPEGALGLARIFGAHRFTDWLTFSVSKAHAATFQPLIALSALALGIGAIVLAQTLYGSNRGVVQNDRDPLQADPNTRGAWGLANARLYWDEIYAAVFVEPFQKAGRFLADVVDWQFLHDYVHDRVLRDGFNAGGRLLSQPVDAGLIDGTVNGLGRVANWVSGRLRRLQTGYVRTYAVVLLSGVILLIIVLLLPLLNGG